MNAERLKQIEEIYHAALEIPPDERESFFGESCGADENLRCEVESLLGFEKSADQFIDTPPESLAAEMFAERAKRTSLAGKEIGRYKIKRLLGAGGMGEVYLAEDTKLNRSVVLKFLSVPTSDDKNLLQRFKQEAFAASALNHPNILTIYEFDAEGEVCFLSAEYIEGETLRETLSRDKLTLPETLGIAKQTAFALSAAHKAGIVHRDVKPENIMLRNDGIVKVLDFGLAKLMERPAVSADELKSNDPDALAKTSVLLKTNPGVVMGTAVYMSPEQARGKDVDERTDIWSLGVCLYEMLTGRQPFSGETTSDTIASILTKEPEPLDENLPAELRRIVRKMLRKNQDKRYQTTRDFLIDLEDAEEELKFQSKLERSGAPSREEIKTQNTGAAATNMDAANSSAGRISSQIKRRTSGIFVALSLLLLTTIGFGYWLNRPPKSESIRSIAVLPFQNESGNADIEQLSDGISESLNNSLSRLPNIKVISRSSAFSYKGKAFDFQQAGRSLHAHAVVTGRVLQRGDMLDISVSLTDTRSNAQLWGQNYKRKLSDVFALQGEIATEVTDSLRIKLTSAEQLKLEEALH